MLAFLFGLFVFVAAIVILLCVVAGIGWLFNKIPPGEDTDFGNNLSSGYVVGMSLFILVVFGYMFYLGFKEFGEILLQNF